MKQKKYIKNRRSSLYFFIALAIIFFIAGNGIALATGYTYTPMEKIPGFGKDISDTPYNDFPNYILSITKFVIWTVGIAALLMIIIGGFMYITSAGNTSRTETAKTVIFDALYGLLVALAAWLLLYVINPDLVRVNISMKPVPAPAAPAPSQAPTPGGATCQNAATPGGTICTDGCNKVCTNLVSYESFINTYASQNSLDSKVVKAIICRESDGNPSAINTTGRLSCGLMQVETTVSDCTQDSRGNLLDPEINIRVGARVLKQKLNQVAGYSYTNVTKNQLAFAAYNCCANGENPNSTSRDCNVANNWGTIPKWACPINPGTGTYNMCDVKDYACKVSACVSRY